MSEKSERNMKPAKGRKGHYAEEQKAFEKTLKPLKDVKKDKPKEK